MFFGAAAQCNRFFARRKGFWAEAQHPARPYSISLATGPQPTPPLYPTLLPATSHGLLRHQSLPPVFEAADPGRNTASDRVAGHWLTRRLGHPKAGPYPVVHVGGARMGRRARVCRDARAAIWRTGRSHKTGLYTRHPTWWYPQTERVQVNRQPLSPEEISQYVEELHPLPSMLSERISPTIIPIITTRIDDGGSLFAICAKAGERRDHRSRAGWAPRRDQHRAKPVLGVITSIGYSHMELLDDTLALIAAGKGGSSSKPGVPSSVEGLLPPEAGGDHRRRWPLSATRPYTASEKSLATIWKNTRIRTWRARISGSTRPLRR